MDDVYSEVPIGACVHWIDIEPVSPTTWRVFFRGKTLIESSRTPAFEACRRVLALMEAAWPGLAVEESIWRPCTINEKP